PETSVTVGEASGTATPFRVSVTSCRSNVSGSIGSEKVTSTEATGVFRGLGETGTKELMLGGTASFVQLALAVPVPGLPSESFTPAAPSVRTYAPSTPVRLERPAIRHVAPDTSVTV